VTKVLDFGQHAYADTFVAESQLNLSEPVFPLQVMLNPESGSLQLGYMSNAEERYNLYSYSYTSSNSNTARTHWDSYAKWAIEHFPFCKGLAIEIGSNDGYLIKQFAGQFKKVIGIDSSATMCEIARESGVEAVQGMFNQSTSATLVEQYGLADLVIANNVFNHANTPVDFAQGVSDILSDRGIFVFEVPYWASMVNSGRFVDMVYHEHPSYFTVKSVCNLLKQAGMIVTEVDVVDYHGGSIRVTAVKSARFYIPDHIQEFINKETAQGLFDPEFYVDLQKKFVHQRDSWLIDFYEFRYKNPDAVIIGVGAAAKANTWLTWHGLNKSHLHCITDASEHKQGKYTPLSRIPIRGDSEFSHHENPYALILSWNISEGLKNTLLKINPNIRFITQ
jgi:SAM-dependent methyltransferase